MFHSAQDIADADHRYCVNASAGLEHEVDDVSMRSTYLELVRYVPLVVTLQEDPEARSVLLHDVSRHFIFVVVHT